MLKMFKAIGVQFCKRGDRLVLNCRSQEYKCNWEGLMILLRLEGKTIFEVLNEVGGRDEEI